MIDNAVTTLYNRNMNKIVDKVADRCRAEYRDGHGGYIEQFDVDKFAELLLTECANVLDDTIAPPSHPMNSIGYKLKEYFGMNKE